MQFTGIKLYFSCWLLLARTVTVTQSMLRESNAWKRKLLTKLEAEQAVKISNKLVGMAEKVKHFMYGG